jgi:Flp pilus assembly protein TadG
MDIGGVQMRMKTFRNDEHGAVLAVVALSLIALMGMAVLVVDVGGLLLAKRRMVTAADSAALAAAQECAGDTANGHNFTTAKAQAAALGIGENGAVAGKIAITSGACNTSRGTVSARYRVGETLSFAPILGLGESMTVSAPATAFWGPARAVRSTPPVNLNGSGADGSTFPCAVETTHPCNFWADNSDPLNSSSSNWSFLALEAPEWPANVAGNDKNRTCPNNDFNSVGGWTSGRETKLIANPTYVCALNGRGGASTRSQQFLALKSMEGKTFQFPVSDPAQKVTTVGREKFAVVGFVTLKVLRVLQGTDSEINGLAGSCAPFPYPFLEPPPSGGNVFDATALYTACAATAPSNAVLSNPIIRDAPPANRNYNTPGDFLWDSVTKRITFLNFPPGGVRDVLINFTWGTPGPCGFQAPDPNSYCIVTEWLGNQLGGTDPDTDPDAPDFGTRAIRLVE